MSESERDVRYRIVKEDGSNVGTLERNDALEQKGWRPFAPDDVAGFSLYTYIYALIYVCVICVWESTDGFVCTSTFSGNIIATTIHLGQTAPAQPFIGFYLYTLHRHSPPSLTNQKHTHTNTQMVIEIPHQCVIIANNISLICARTEPPAPVVDPSRPQPTPPTITVQITSPVLQIVEYGQTVRLTCSGYSLVNRIPIYVSWHRENGRLPEDRSYTESGGGTLVLNQVRYDDSGVYVCQASNGTEMAEQKLTLTVGSKCNSIQIVLSECLKILSFPGIICQSLFEGFSG